MKGRVSGGVLGYYKKNRNIGSLLEKSSEYMLWVKISKGYIHMQPGRST